MNTFQQQSKIAAKKLARMSANDIRFFCKTQTVDQNQDGVWMDVCSWDITDEPNYYAMVGVANTTVPRSYSSEEETAVLPEDIGNPDLWCFYPDWVLARAALQVSKLPLPVAIRELFRIASDADIGACGCGYYGYQLYMSEVAELLGTSMFNKHFRAAFISAAKQVSFDTYENPGLSWDWSVLV